MREERSVSSPVFSRREFLKLVGLTGASGLLSACSDYRPSRPTPWPTRTPTEVPTPYPTLIPATPESIATTIPRVSITTRNVAFGDATPMLNGPSLRDSMYERIEIPRERDSDWFSKVSETRDPRSFKKDVNKEVYAYYSSREKKLYTGFGYVGRDHEILGWQDIGVNNSGRHFTDIPGRFGYEVAGSTKKGEYAFIFADIPNSRKTFIKYAPFEDKQHYINFEFDISHQGNVLAINQLTTDNIPEKGVYLLDTKKWGLLNHVREHVNDMQISEDGSLIYSSSGKGYSSMIIHAASGQVEDIPWEFAGVYGNVYRDENTEVLSPNFKYISTYVYGFYSNPYAGIAGGNSRLLYTLVNTPTGFVKLSLNDRSLIEKITNEGVVHYYNGEVINLKETTKVTPVSTR